MIWGVNDTGNAVNSTRPHTRSLLAATAAVVAADQLSKAAVLATLEPGQPLYLIGDWFRFYLLFNSGAAFSMGENLTPVFTAIQLFFGIGIIIVIIRGKVSRIFGRPDAIAGLGLALIAGGALGNVIDRLFRAPGFFIGHVVDFISIGSFAVFNLADSAITIGVALIVLRSIMEAK